MIVDFRKKKIPVEPLTINGAVIDTVDCFKFLGTTVSNTLGWDANVEVTVEKAQQRLFFLRQLKKFGLRRESLIQFYNSVVESVLTFSLCVWYGNTTQRQRDRLERVIRTAVKIIGCELPSLASIYSKRSVARARKIIADVSHPAKELSQLPPSGKRYRSFKSRTNRFKNSYFPLVVSALSTENTCDIIHPAAVRVTFFF